MILQFLIPFFLLFQGFHSTTSQADKKVAVIIDADTANEIDDLYALVQAMASDKLDIRAITSAQFHTSPIATDTSVMESQIINERLAQLSNRTDIPLPVGANFPMTSPTEPQVSPASNFIIQEAKKMKNGQKLDLVILGPCTNVASAIVQDPSIIPLIRVHYLGIWHDPEANTFDKNEFNSRNDKVAVDVLFDTPNLDLTIMSATSSQHLKLAKTKADEELKGKSELGDYLIARWDNHKRWWTRNDPEKKTWIMWDLAIIQALINPEWSKVEEFTTPPENTQRIVKVHTYIYAQAMEDDFWKTMKTTFHQTSE